jgi:hypothetical protein
LKKNTEALVVASKDFGLEVNAEKLSVWSCLVSSMQEEITTQRQEINLSKGWNNSNIWGKH